MTPTEQTHSSLPTISLASQSSDTETNDIAHSSIPQSSDDMHTQYDTPTSTKMTTNKTYSPAPDAHDIGVLYSPLSYNQHSTGMHHQTAILTSPPSPYIHSTIGSPSPSAASSTYSNHYQRYTNTSNFPLASLVSPTLQPLLSPSPSSQQAMRTVYLGNLAPDTQISDILDQVRSGFLETARLLSEKKCVFLTFIDAGAASHFYHQVSHRPLTLNGMEFKVGWGKPSDLPTHIHLALQNGASRNVFLGSLDDTVSEEGIREDLKRFGTIEHVRLLQEKKIAFVHFLSIANAIKCVTHLPNEVEWQNRRIYYGRDRCCPNITNTNTMSTSPPALRAPSSYHHHQPHYYSPHHHHPIHVQHHAYQVRFTPSFAYDPYTGTTIESYATAPPPPHHQIHHHHHHHHQSTIPPTTTAHVILSPPPSLAPTLTSSMHGDMTTAAVYPPPQSYAGGNDAVNLPAGVANRTVYLGNIHPDTTCEDICNVVRGGLLSQIRYMVDKHIAFLVFVDPAQALQFYTQANYHGMVIKNRRLKLGWGKPSSLSRDTIQAVQSGGSRNVYLGNMINDNNDEEDAMDEAKLKHDFSEYGEIELVNTLKEKNCAFINFTSIAAAMRAIEGIRTKEGYKRFRINYGKDRCGNPPRSATTAAATAAAAGLQKTTTHEQQLVETTTTTTSSSSSSSSTTNSVTTPPTTCSHIAHVPHTPTITTNQGARLPLVDNPASTLVNGLEMMPAAFTSSSSNSFNETSLTELIAHPDVMVTDVTLN